jgi:hypothetical protein
MRLSIRFTIPHLIALLVLAIPASARADANLFRFYPEAALSGFYSDNIPLRTFNGEGDFAALLVGGFFLDYTSADRYALLHWDTYAQLFAHQSQFDRAGEGQFVTATDYETLSPTTHLRFDDFYYRDAQTPVVVTTSDQAPELNPILAIALLASDTSSANHFSADMYKDWGRNWYSEVSVHQTTYWFTAQNGTENSTTYSQLLSAFLEYRFNEKFSAGPGYRFYDFRFTAPGEPAAEAHWPFLRVQWLPTSRITFQGNVGPTYSYTFGTDRQAVNIAGIGLLEYRFHRGHFSVYGGQEPEVTPGVGGAGHLRLVTAHISYELTRRVTIGFGAGYYESSGTGIDDQLVSWGPSLIDRVNSWLTLSTRFVQVRRNLSGPSSVLPDDNQSGSNAVANYIVIGASVSFEAFRWSWQ